MWRQAYAKNRWISCIDMSSVSSTSELLTLHQQFIINTHWMLKNNKKCIKFEKHPTSSAFSTSSFFSLFSYSSLDGAFVSFIWQWVAIVLVIIIAQHHKNKNEFVIEISKENHITKVVEWCEKALRCKKFIMIFGFSDAWTKVYFFVHICKKWGEM